ncbi:unnamed protein product [Microthlaspi erraticum]|uniref:Aspartic peptidase DDI1-type domain-containing protein n=1 Tax=Microthlaspi erraticum TaxID=1685480 RepID=A0A6D2I3W2_9BRAS|nr:unnamed protein product [Microthlaspi erraticum]
MCKQLLLRVEEFFRESWYHQEAMRTLRFKRRRSQSTLKLKSVEKGISGTRACEAERSAAEPSKGTRRKGNSFCSSTYSNQLAFSNKVQEANGRKCRKVFDQQMSEINLKIPFIDALMMIKPYQKFLKDAILERTKEVQGMVVLSQECSAIIQSKAVTRSLVILEASLSLFLGPLAFKKSLCDLGASVSIMPLTVARRLGFEKYKECHFSLILADRSVKLPVGMLEDMPLKVGSVIVPTDFVVVRWMKNPKTLILGRPFLATAGAIIDVRRGKIELNLGKDCKMVFNVKDVMKQPTINGESFYIETLEQLADDYLEELV